LSDHNFIAFNKSLILQSSCHEVARTSPTTDVLADLGRLSVPSALDSRANRVSCWVSRLFLHGTFIWHMLPVLSGLV
jgi:hypothetical protein